MTNRTVENRWSYKHGGARRGTNRDAEYSIWQNMKRRCLDPSNKSYKDYGGRGITVCNEWVNDYQRFLADIGARPTDNHTLERIDNDGNYEPSNCRWATKTEQAKNKRPRATDIFVDGVSLKQLALQSGISYYTLYWRYKKGRRLM